MILADAYIHDLDPVLLPIWGNLSIRYYGLAYLMGFVIAYLLTKWMGRTGRIAIPANRAGDFLMVIVVAVIVGGRLGYVFFYDLPRALSEGETPLLWYFSGSAPYWGLLAVQGGGMSAHGGIVGVIIACILFARSLGISKLHVLDFASFGCPPGLFLGRIANFINGELWGKALPPSYGNLETDAPWWSVKYPEEIMLLPPARAEALLARVDLPPPRPSVLAPDVWQNAVDTFATDGESRSIVLGRIMEQVREGDTVVIEAIRPFLTAFYPSQLIQAFAEGILLWLVLILIWLVPRKPGVVGGWFLITYGVLRILTEIFRQPDEGVAILFGLQRGQLLSVLMVLGGAIGLAIVTRRKVPKMGGLARGRPAGG